MRERNTRLFAPGPIVCISALLLLFSSPVSGHRVNIFAATESSRISGYVYFSGGSRAKNVTVQVSGPDGAEFGHVSTNEKGEFTYEATHGCDHLLTVETADGHRATWTVKADELPESLPGASAKGDGEPVAPARAEAPLLAPADAPGVRAVEQRIAQSVAAQVRPLREQIARLEEKIRLRDVIGGIGYLLGVAGIAFYFLGVRKLAADRDARRRED